MALSLAMKRPAEDLHEPSFHTNSSAMDISSIKLLSEVLPARGAKRRKDDFPSFVRASANSYDAGEESDDGASFPDYAPLDDHTDLAVHGGSMQHSANSVSQASPCLWLSGNSPSRNPEADDHAMETHVQTEAVPPRSCTPPALHSSATPQKDDGSFPCVWLNGTTNPETPDRAQSELRAVPLASPTHHNPIQQAAAQKNMSFPCVWLDDDNTRRVENQGVDPKVPDSLRTPEKSTLPITPPPALEPLPKGTLVIQPSPPMGDENQPPNLMSPYAPKSMSSTPTANPDLLKSNIFMNSLPPVVTPRSTPMHKDPMGGYTPMNTTLEGDTDLSTDLNGDNMEVCPECNKVFKRKVYLQRHMEREHWSTAKVFKCQDCAYETKHQSNLSVHRRTHTGERPYHCGACGQRYTQGHLLKSHIRSRHAGNMEFYNLDKKSDSTRGRKSLDIKHELLGVPTKQDKISALLQAAAANSAVGAMGSSAGVNQMPHMPKYGGNLLNQQYMNSLQYFSPLRPMMGNPMHQLAAGGLLGSPRFFNMPGLPPPNNFGQTPHNSLMSPLGGVGGAMGMLNSNNHSVNESLKKTMEALDMKSHLKMLSPNMMGASSPPMGTGLQVPIKMPAMNMMSPNSRTPHMPQLSPQDLTTKKSPAEADVPDYIPISKRMLLSQMVSEPQDLSNPRFGAVGSGASPARPQESDSATIPSPSHESVQSSYDRMSPTFKHRSLVNKSWPNMATPPPSDEEELVKDGVLEKSVHDLVKEDTIAHGDHECNDNTCPHLRKLKDLRRNVFRMLSVFTPDLSFENGISSETEDVDELLYEVIYTNIDEDNTTAEKA